MQHLMAVCYNAESQEIMTDILFTVYNCGVHLLEGKFYSEK